MPSEKSEEKASQSAARTAREHAIKRFIGQFALQLEMILNGRIPYGYPSPDFILRTLDRRQYDPEIRRTIRTILPLLKEEVRYLEAEETVQRLAHNREERRRKMQVLWPADEHRPTTSNDLDAQGSNHA